MIKVRIFKLVSYILQWKGCTCLMLPFGVTLDFIPWPSSLIPSLFSYPNRNIKSLSEIQIVQVACGYYHSLALSKGKQDSSKFCVVSYLGILKFSTFHCTETWILKINLRTKVVLVILLSFFFCTFLIFFFFKQHLAFR